MKIEILPLLLVYIMLDRYVYEVSQLLKLKHINICNKLFGYILFLLFISKVTIFDITIY